MDVSKWNIIPEENDTVKTVIYHEIIYIICPQNPSLSNALEPSCRLLDFQDGIQTILEPYGSQNLHKKDVSCVGCGLPEVAKCCRYCCWFMTFHGLLIIVFRFGCRILESLDWFKGKSTGNHGFYHQM